MKPIKATPQPPVILYYCRLLCDISVVVLIVLCFGVDFLLFDPYVRFLILRSVRVTERPPIGEQLFTRLTICFLGIRTYVSFSIFPPLGLWSGNIHFLYLFPKINLAR